ncbi:hypothetical protein ASF27_14600 [Methylobacterium sp. Leaf102]|uniref:RNA polymerase sigma factor n=1 Tax=Methylobacterium sp. Leaf102 TaxID=1736253 RepID=UPI0006FF435E|nr:hypothetical protein [Methylobacterium sp. Leaf102]KQP22316.1 hypothetical protein ASF27_14600 [Methylobacterium sp. Leaf102]
MNADIGVSQERLREFWTGIVERGGLARQDPRQIVAGCRRLHPRRHERLRGDLVIHLAERAERVLRALAGAGLRHGGEDPVGDVVDAMVEAVLDPSSADGAGFEQSFRGKLQHRLIDKIRRGKVRRDIEQPAVCDAEGQPVDPIDGSSLGPEDEAMIQSVLAQLPEKHRLAFKLFRQGFDFSSKADKSIAGMLNITPKTAKEWVDRARERIAHELGRTP